MLALQFLRYGSDTPPWASRIIEQIYDHFDDNGQITTSRIVAEMELPCAVSVTTNSFSKPVKETIAGQLVDIFPTYEVFEFTWATEAEYTMFLLKWS